jgi:hypothetical protein
LQAHALGDIRLGAGRPAVSEQNTATMYSLKGLVEVSFCAAPEPAIRDAAFRDLGREFGDASFAAQGRYGKRIDVDMRAAGGRQASR